MSENSKLNIIYHKLQQILENYYNNGIITVPNESEIDLRLLASQVFNRITEYEAPPTKGPHQV